MPTTYPLTDESTGLTLPVTVSEGGPLTESEKQQIFSDYYAKNPRKPAYTQEQMNSQMEAVKTEPPQVGRVPMFNKSGNQVYQATASDLASQVVPINTQSAVKAYPKANTTGQRTAPDVSIPNYETTALPFLQMYESQINPGMNPYEKAAIPNTPAQQITRGFLGGLESFGTPTNAAILAGTSGASMALEALNAIKAARAVQLATTGLFAGQAGVSAINETRQAIENFQNNNPDEGYRNLGGAAVSGAMTGALGLGVKKGVKEFNSPIEKVNQPKTDTKAVTPPDDVSLAPYKQGDMVQVIGEASDTPLTVVRTILDGKMVLVKDSKGNAHKFLPSFLKPATVNQAGEQFVPPIVKKSGPTNETPTQEHVPINEVSGQDHGSINETSRQEHGPINEVSGTKYQGPRKPKATETPAQTELPLSGSVKDQLPPKTPTFKDDIEEGEHILATNTRLSSEDRQAVQGKIDEARKNQYLEKTPQGPINEVSREPQGPTNIQSGELQDPTIPTANLPSPTENAATPPINAPKATPSTTLPPPPSPAATAQKMPWEMTSLEYRRIKGYRGLEETAKGLREHRYAVLFAVMEGKPVPEFVLPEYKGLAWADAELAKRKEATVSAETASRLDATGAAAQKMPWEIRLKQLKSEISVLADKGGLTKQEGERFRTLNAEANSIRFDNAKPLDAAKIPSPQERKSTLPTDVVVAARNDLMRDKSIYEPVIDSAVGVSHNADTAIDNIIGGKDPNITLRRFYDAFNATREAMRKHYGDTIRLFRAVGKQKDKATTNWATTREYAAQFGDDVVSKDFSIDEVIAVNVGLNGKYHEIIVGKKPATPAATTLPPVRIGGEPVRGERSQPYRLPLASKGSNENAENSRLILSSLVSVVKNEGGKYTDENINDAKYLLTKRTAYKEITKPQADLLAQLFNDHNLPYSARNVLNKFEKAITPEPVMSENEAINQGLSVRGVDKDTVKQPKPKLAESLGEHLDYNKELLLKNNSTVPEAYKVAVKDFLIKLQDLDKDSTGKELEPEALQVAQELVKNKVIPSSDLRAEAISLIKAAGKKSTLLKSTEGEPLLGGGSVAGNPSVTESPRVSSKIEKSPEEIRQGKITELVDRITENHPEFSDELSAAVENMNRGIKDEETNGLIDSLKDIIKDKEADKNVRKIAQSLMQELKELPDATEDVPETDPYLNPDHLDNVYDINPDDEGGFLRVGKGSGKKRFNNRGALDLSPVVQAYSKMVQRIEDFQKKRELTKRISSDRNVPESLAYRAAEPFHYVFNKETPDPLDRKALAWIRYAQAEEKPLTEYLERSKESKDATERGFPAEIQRAIELEGTTETTRKNFEVSSILQKEYQNDIESGLDYKEKLNYTPISVQYKGSNFEQLNFTQRRTNFSPLDLSEQVDKGKLTDIKSIETDLGNLTALRIYEGQRRIARNVLSAELQGMSHKGEYILRQPKLVDEQVEHSNPPKGYDTINIFGKSMYVQKGFKPLFSSLFNDGILTHNAYAKALDNYNSFAKTILFGVESFHDAQQHYMHLAGTREVPNLTGKLVPKIGRLLLDYTPEYARKQLSKGEIDQKTYDRFMEEYPKLAYAKNLKLGRTYEKTYMDYINSIPGGKKLFGLITPYTNYIFQTKGRAMAVELFIKNFDNNKKAYPSKTLEDLGRMSANETHIQMGMVGREGFLKSKDAQMVGRLLFLAARYRESKMLFEARAIGQTVKSITGLTKGQLHMGNLAKTALSLTALGFVINQMINYGFNGHSTFENSTEGDDSAMDKLAAKVNIKGGEVTIPVTTYAFPITSQIYRYMSRGDNILIAAGKLGLNGISYSGHILYNAYERIGDEFRPNRGEDIVKQLAIDIVPMPFLVKEFFLKGYPKTQIFGMSGIRARESSRYTAKEALYKGAKNDTRAITEWYGGRANKALEDTKKKIQTDGITDPKIKSQLYRESLIDVFDSIKNDNDFPTEVDKKIAVNKVQKIAISRMIGDTTMRVFLSKETLGEENK